jgi:mono/diheme cytochrome c family protein
MKKLVIAGLAVVAVLCLVAAPVFAQDNPGGGGLRAPPAVTGQQVFQQVCAACHMQDAKGGTGAGTIPALAGNPRLAAAAYPIVTVLNGKNGMPWLRDLLTPAQIAAVVTYVRTNFGNNYPAPVTEAEVARIAAITPHP